MIKAIIFDLDGTLVETKEANYISYKSAFLSVGFDLDRELFFEAYGFCFEDMIEHVAPHLTVKSRHQVKKEKSDIYKENLDKTIVNNGLLAIIQNGRQTYQTALVTTASRANAMMVMTHHGIENFFDVMVFGEDVSKGKPSPECYEIAVSRLGVSSSECVVFEDTPIGIKSGRSAGCTVIDVSGWMAK